MLEWPTEVLDPAPARLHLAMPSSCAVGTVGTTPVEVSVGAVGPRACVGVARETLGDLDWCSRPMVREVEYGIREWYPWFHLRHRARVTIGADGARFELDGKSRVTEHTASLREMLEPLWEMPSEIEESCRDGTLKVVEMRRPERWKVIIRSCRQVVDLRRIGEVVRG